MGGGDEAVGGVADVAAVVGRLADEVDVVLGRAREPAGASTAVSRSLRSPGGRGPAARSERRGSERGRWPEDGTQLRKATSNALDNTVQVDLDGCRPRQKVHFHRVLGGPGSQDHAHDSDGQQPAGTAARHRAVAADRRAGATACTTWQRSTSTAKALDKGTMADERKVPPPAACFRRSADRLGLQRLSPRAQRQKHGDGTPLAYCRRSSGEVAGRSEITRQAHREGVACRGQLASKPLPGALSWRGATPDAHNLFKRE